MDVPCGPPLIRTRWLGLLRPAWTSTLTVPRDRVYRTKKKKLGMGRRNVLDG